MTEKYLYFLDSQTKNAKRRVTVFGEDAADCIRDFQKWMEDLELTKDDLWYADVFDIFERKRLYSLEVEDEGVYLVKVPEDDGINPLRRRRTFMQVLAAALRDWAKSLNEKAWKDAA